MITIGNISLPTQRSGAQIIAQLVRQAVPNTEPVTRYIERVDLDSDQAACERLGLARDRLGYEPVVVVVEVAWRSVGPTHWPCYAARATISVRRWVGNSQDARLWSYSDEIFLGVSAAAEADDHRDDDLQTAVRNALRAAEQAATAHP